MAFAALLAGTLAGIMAFASALTLGHTLGTASLAWWSVGTLVALWPLVAIAMTNRDETRSGRFAA